MASIISTRNYQQLASKIFKAIYTNSAPFKPLRYPSIFNDYSGDYERSFFQYLSLIGFGTLATRNEGEVPIIDTSKEGISSYFPYATWALQYIVTKEMQREDVKSIIPKLPALLRYSSDQTKEYNFWNVFNFAFNTAVKLADGQPLCSTAHPLQGSSVQPGVTTYSNSLGAVPFTVETLEQAYILMSTIPDDRGLLSYRTPQKLIYPPAMHQIATEVLSSTYYPSSDENRVNVVAGSIQPMPIEYLTAAANGPFPWFVLSGMGEPGSDSHSVFATIKWDEQDTYTEDRTQSVVHSTEFRAAFGAVDGRGVVGSQGAM